MSDTSTTTTTEAPGANGTGATTEQQTPPAERTFSQADVDRIVAERLKRENLQELRAKATKLDSLENDRKTEDERVAERLAKLEERNKQLEVDGLRMRVANRFKISEEDAELFLTADNEDDLTKQAKRLSEKVADADRTRGRNHVPREGQSSTPQESAERKLARQLFSDGE